MQSYIIIEGTIPVNGCSSSPLSVVDSMLAFGLVFNEDSSPVLLTILVGVSARMPMFIGANLTILSYEKVGMIFDLADAAGLITGESKSFSTCVDELLRKSLKCTTTKTVIAEPNRIATVIIQGDELFCLRPSNAAVGVTSVSLTPLFSATSTSCSAGSFVKRRARI